MEITLEKCAAEWFHVHVEGRLASNTEGGYRNLIFNHIVPKLGGAALTGLGEKRIRSFYRKLSSAGLNDRSVWCVHLLLRRTSYEAHRYVLSNHIIPCLGECELAELSVGMVPRLS